LSSSWCNLSEDIVVESDLSPQQSNDWSLIVDGVMDKCDYKLTKLLSIYYEQLRKTIGINQLLNLKGSESNEFTKSARASLEKLIQPKSKVEQLDQLISKSSNVMNQVTLPIPRMSSVDDFTLPLDKQTVDYLMDYLFPDANLINQSSKAKRKEETQIEFESAFGGSLLKSLKLVKASSSSGNGLLNRLSECMANLIRYGQLKAMAQLWREFLLELRYRFDNSIYINGLEDVGEVISSGYDSTPNLSRCLLHQKVQMLNCCIRKRLERDSLFQQQQTTDVTWNSKDSVEKEDDEDEFFDCDEEDSNGEGRLKRFNEFTLIQRPTEPLYVPITQVLLIRNLLIQGQI
jgi:Rab3 GTPase-activating protein catalytic subunit